MLPSRALLIPVLLDKLKLNWSSDYSALPLLFWFSIFLLYVSFSNVLCSGETSFGELDLLLIFDYKVCFGILSTLKGRDFFAVSTLLCLVVLNLWPSVILTVFSRNSPVPELIVFPISGLGEFRSNCDEVAS